MRTWQIILLAIEGLRRRPLRAVLTTLGVVIASGALISMVAFGLGVQSHAEAPFAQLDMLNLIKVWPRNGKANLDDQALATMEHLPGVVSAYPNLVAAGIKVVHGEKAGEGVAVGVPREVAAVGLVDEFLVAGKAFDGHDQPQVIVGQRLAHDLGLGEPEEALGRVVTLKASGLMATDETTLKYAEEKLDVTVVGIYRLPDVAPSFLVPRGIMLPMELMRELPGVEVASRMAGMAAGRRLDESGYQEVWVRTRKPASVPDVEDAVRKMGFRTMSTVGRLEDLRTFFVFLDVLLAAIGTVGLVVAGLGIANTLLMSVLERYQEIGICKAIGASDGDIRILFLIEAGLCGLIGGLGGVGLGRLVSWLLGLGINAYLEGRGIERSLDLFEFPWWLMTATLLFSVLASILAGVYPAAHAAKVDPVRALRGE